MTQDLGPAGEGDRPGGARSYPGWVGRVARFVVRVFFSRVEVVGAERIPGSGPLLYVANHNNALVDPLLVMGFLPGRPRFLAKSTLWDNPVLRPFLALGRVIPVYRRRDPGFDASRNQEVFARCREVLAAGGAVALFPEGQSHNEPSLTEMKTGAARIVAGSEPAVRATRIVPVGLVFDAKSRFRSQVLVQVGNPLAPLAAATEDSRAEVRELTERIGAGLGSVTLNYPSWEEARLLARAAEIYLHAPSDLPAPEPLSRRFDTLKAFLEAYGRLARERPATVAALAAAVEEYDGLLSGLGLRDDQVTSSYEAAAVGRALRRDLVGLTLRLPVAAIGLLLNVLPYRICAALAAAIAKDPDEPATYKLFGGILLYPLFWLAEGALAGWGWGPVAGAAVAVLGALGAGVALTFLDLWKRLRREARAYLLLRRGGSAVAEVRRRRARLRQELLALAAPSAATH